MKSRDGGSGGRTAGLGRDRSVRRLASLTAVGTSLGALLWAACDSGPTDPTDESVSQAVATISAAELREIVYTIAHDSMRGRASPSPGLEKTALFIADRFESFGLRQGGESGYLQFFSLAPPLSVVATAVSSDPVMNVIGWLPGSDPDLEDEYVVLTAHMDHLGVLFPVHGDSIYNGADDNASGTAALVELAEAFSSLPVAPRRSVVFIAFGAEESGLIGSRYYTDHPTLPLEMTVANLNMDMIGRNWPDTLVAIRSSAAIGAFAEAVGAEHPELGLDVVDDLWPGENLIRRSDQWHFIRHGVPAIFFHTGLHADYHQPSDEPELLDYEKTKRVTRLIFHVALELANTDQTPD